tara:strand:- start:260 stop:484 length:225 start_codon:yes stop_codon:yes gene_type:complete
MKQRFTIEVDISDLKSLDECNPLGDLFAMALVSARLKEMKIITHKLDDVPTQEAMEQICKEEVEAWERIVKGLK